METTEIIYYDRKTRAIRTRRLTDNDIEITIFKRGTDDYGYATDFHGIWGCGQRTPILAEQDAIEAIHTIA